MEKSNKEQKSHDEEPAVPGWMAFMLPGVGGAMRLEAERKKKLEIEKWCWDNKIVFGPSSWEDYEKQVNEEINKKQDKLLDGMIPSMEDLKDEGKELLEVLAASDDDDDDDDEIDDRMPAAKET